MKFLLRCAANIAVVAFVSMSFLRAAVPVEDDILAQTISPQSENYYPNLWLRYEMGDSTLTAENYHYLYYGYAHQESYRPLVTNPHMDKFLMLASGIDLEDPNPDVLRSVISAGRDALTYDPFSPKIWNLLAFAYGVLGDEESERLAYLRVENILSTIQSSGGGFKQSDPQHILMFDHALDLMTSENLNHTKALVVSREVEYVPLIAPVKTADGKKVRGLYFDFSRIYWNKPDSVTYKRDRTWQFNNLKPREYK
ncbi:MAG: DUF4919 domain-containing protein [Rikenellaceae bacterium]